MKSFLDLLGLHAELDTLFHEHQRALVRQDFARAHELVARFARALKAHAREEDELLLPFYRALPSHERGSAPELFALEHVKLLEFAAHFESRALALAEGRGGGDTVTQTIRLLDLEATFKHLVEHHNTREERYLYPALDAALNEEEKASLFARLTQHAPSD